MIKVWLLITACSVTNAADCLTLKRQTDPVDDFTIQRCMNTAQYYAAEWVNAHPNYRITGFRCIRSDAPDLESALGGQDL